MCFSSPWASSRHHSHHSTNSASPQQQSLPHTQSRATNAPLPSLIERALLHCLKIKHFFSTVSPSHYLTSKISQMAPMIFAPPWVCILATPTSPNVAPPSSLHKYVAYNSLLVCFIVLCPISILPLYNSLLICFIVLCLVPILPLYYSNFSNCPSLGWLQPNWFLSTLVYSRLGW